MVLLRRNRRRTLLDRLRLHHRLLHGEAAPPGAGERKGLDHGSCDKYYRGNSNWYGIHGALGARGVRGTLRILLVRFADWPFTWRHLWNSGCDHGHARSCWLRACDGYVWTDYG